MQGTWGVASASAAVASGKLKSSDLVLDCLERYRATEPAVHAFAWLDEERALRAAQRRDRQPPRGPLHGIPIAVKDIFDTAGVPTECGTRLFAGRIPHRSAAAVTALRSAGAIMFGKTVTAELAYYTPGPTRNPYDLSRTPGGSSQGSAAAVAAGVVPGAIGSQTNGSTIRPAAFCGVVGFKPSRGLILNRGCLHLSRTLDQVGVFARSVLDAAVLEDAIARPGASTRMAPAAAPRLAVVPTSDWPAAESGAQAQFLQAVDALAASGATVLRPELPPGIEEAWELVRVLMAYEARQSLGEVADRNRGALGTEVRELLAQGETIGHGEYEATRRQRRNLIWQFRRWMADVDAIVTLPARGEAPSMETTGDPRFCTRWTLLGAPAITIPSGLGPSGLPLGLQFVALPGADATVLGVAHWAEQVLQVSLPQPAITVGTSASTCR